MLLVIYGSILVLKETMMEVIVTGKRAWERVAWMDYHSDYKHLPQRLLLIIYHYSESKQ